MAAVMIMTGCGAKDEAKTATESDAKAGIVLGEYKNVPVTVVKPSVSDEELDARIETVLGGYATWDAVDRAAEEGDRVNIDYKGLKDGVAFEGGTAEGYNLVLGSGSFIDGFEDGLIGAAAMAFPSFPFVSLTARMQV